MVNLVVARKRAFSLRRTYAASCARYSPGRVRGTSDGAAPPPAPPPPSPALEPRPNMASSLGGRAAAVGRAAKGPQWVGQPKSRSGSGSRTAAVGRAAEGPQWVKQPKDRSGLGSTHGCCYQSSSPQRRRASPACVQPAMSTSYFQLQMSVSSSSSTPAPVLFLKPTVLPSYVLSLSPLSPIRLLLSFAVSSRILPYKASLEMVVPMDVPYKL